MKTKEEMDALKKESEAVNNKLQELTEENLGQVAGGTDIWMPYVVREHDTLWDLAIKRNTTVQAIVMMNPKVIKDPNKIYPGMEILLPLT